MRSVTRILLCAAGAIVASLLTACGSGNSTAAPANIRVVNDTDAAVTMTLSGGTTIPSVASSAASTYVALTPGTYTASVAGVSTSLTAGPAQTLGLGTGQNYTTIAYQRNNVVYGATIADSLTIPTAGATLDIVNVSPDAGPLDVYFLPLNTTSLAGQAPSFASVQGLTPASTFAAGSYTVIVAAAGSTSDVRLTLPSIVLATGQVGTLALTSTTGGALVNAALLNQGGSAAFYKATQSRVRVFSALPTADLSAVVVTAGTHALPQVFAPNTTGYTLVPAGTAIASVAVNLVGGGSTAPASLPAGTLVAGQDYTVLVYGTSAAPVVQLIADDNQTKTNFASVRLINAALYSSSSPTAGAAMYINSLPTAPNVVLGQASAYYGVAPASQAAVKVDFPGYANGTLSGTSAPDLYTGAVYTVIVYDAAQPPAVIRDR